MKHKKYKKLQLIGEAKNCLEGGSAFNLDDPTDNKSHLSTYVTVEQLLVSPSTLKQLSFQCFLFVITLYLIIFERKNETIWVVLKHFENNDETFSSCVALKLGSKLNELFFKTLKKVTSILNSNKSSIIITFLIVSWKKI